jgi:hypothetical protein
VCYHVHRNGQGLAGGMNQLELSMALHGLQVSD